MNEIKCILEGCISIFKTKESIFPNARYICKNHTRRQQLEAINRIMIDEDTKDSEVHFQEHQFDKALSGRKEKLYYPDLKDDCSNIEEILGN